MTRVFVVQHTEATHHVDGRVGGGFDSQLTERGRAQADAVAGVLTGRVAGPAAVYSSDLTRARQTAEPIARVLQTEVLVSPDIREVGCGVAEGKPQAWLEARITLPPADPSRMDHVIIDGAETRRSAALRTRRFVDEVLLPRTGDAVVVTHGFAATFLISAWIGMPVEAMTYVRFGLSSGSISFLEVDDWGNRAVSALNDTGHLGET